MYAHESFAESRRAACNFLALWTGLIEPVSVRPAFFCAHTLLQTNYIGDWQTVGVSVAAVAVDLEVGVRQQCWERCSRRRRRLAWSLLLACHGAQSGCSLPLTFALRVAATPPTTHTHKCTSHASSHLQRHCLLSEQECFFSVIYIRVELSRGVARDAVLRAGQCRAVLACRHADASAPMQQRQRAWWACRVRRREHTVAHLAAD